MNLGSCEVASPAPVHSGSGRFFVSDSRRVRGRSGILWSIGAGFQRLPEQSPPGARLLRADRAPPSLEATMEANFPYKTVPKDHQRTELDFSHDLEARGLFWEPGCMKTWVVVNTAGSLWLRGKLDILIVLAPDGVQYQWVEDEIPDHMPMPVQDSMESFIWDTDKSNNVGFKAKFEEFRKRPRAKGLRVLAMTFDSLRTERAALSMKKLIKDCRVMLVADESTRIKTPGAFITKRCRALAKRPEIVYRRALNGTPVSDSPFHLYSQLCFLQPDLFKNLGIQDFGAFQVYFGQHVLRKNHQTGRHFNDLIGYQRLDELHDIMKGAASRLLKKDVLDIPPKVFRKVYFELTPTQRRMYDELREDYETQMDSGEMVTAELGIVRDTRLQQITSGYLPADDEKDLRPLIKPEDNPRLKVLASAIEDIPDGDQVLLWGKYDIDVDLMVDMLRRRFKWKVGVWDGRTKTADRQAAKEGFLKGDLRVMVSKQSSSLARGHNLQVAKHVIFYNNSFVLDDRLQAEDRAHRGTIDWTVNYLDIIGRNTVDGRILQNLRQKRRNAAQVTGDSLEQWI